MEKVMLPENTEKHISKMAFNNKREKEKGRKKEEKKRKENYRGH